jgi:hypothetical protein
MQKDLDGMVHHINFPVLLPLFMFAVLASAAANASCWCTCIARLHPPLSAIAATFLFRSQAAGTALLGPAFGNIIPWYDPFFPS